MFYIFRKKLKINSKHEMPFRYFPKKEREFIFRKLIFNL